MKNTITTALLCILILIPHQTHAEEPQTPPALGTLQSVAEQAIDTLANNDELANPSAPEPQHAIALHGSAKYGPDFKHVGYVNPNAPKGGTLKLNAIGSFDSLNPFIVKGTPAAGLAFIRSGLVYESLMQNAWDEPFTLMA